MPFITIPGLTGKIYLPVNNAAVPRKHRCRDCFSCQACSDDRCQLCLENKTDPPDCCCSQENSDENRSDI